MLSNTKQSSAVVARRLKNVEKRLSLLKEDNQTKKEYYISLKDELNKMIANMEQVEEEREKEIEEQMERIRIESRELLKEESKVYLGKVLELFCKLDYRLAARNHDLTDEEMEFFYEFKYKTLMAGDVGKIQKLLAGDDEAYDENYSFKEMKKLLDRLDAENKADNLKLQFLCLDAANVAVEEHVSLPTENISFGSFQ